MGVSSDIPDQPIGINETFTGAKNRVKNLKTAVPDGDYFVGIEGGIQKIENDWFAFAWIVIESAQGLIGKAQTGHFLLPPKVTELIAQGYELGHADDMVFGKTNSKQKSGSVGIMTDDIIDRMKYYEHAMILALVPFKKPELFI